MLLSLLLLIPVIGILIISTIKNENEKQIKYIALLTSLLNLFICILIYILYDFSFNQFQFVQEYHEISYFNFYLGVDGLSIYFLVLTCIIIPISLLSN
jgi:NADH-ubiquinone oxidoreductase chain 4